MARALAYVKDEKSGEDPFFIYVRHEHAQTSGGDLRFRRQTVANQVCSVINAAFKSEGRLLVEEYPD